MAVTLLYQIFSNEWSATNAALCGALTKELAEEIFRETYPQFSKVKILWHHRPDKDRYENTWCYDGFMEIA